MMVELGAWERRQRQERSWWRRKPPRKRVRAERPGKTPPMPPGWARRCQLTLKRDQFTCRRCGLATVLTPKAVDHVIPRRLFPNGVAASIPTNCATLCRECHGWKTATLEPALYRGDVLAFNTFLRVLASTGPIPKSAIVAEAFGRLRRFLDAQYRDKARAAAKGTRLRKLRKIQEARSEAITSDA